MSKQIVKRKKNWLLFTFLSITIFLSSCLQESNKERRDNTSDSDPEKSRQLSTEQQVHSYNVKNKPNLSSSPKLKKVIDDLLLLSKKKNLPLEDISITIIDVKENAWAQYKGETSRYPASIPKLFWLVIAYSYVESGQVNLDSQLANSIKKMIEKSDNEGASRVIDQITNTKSGAVLSEQNFNNWLQKRGQLNDFFKEADYDNINISQKTYPIPYLEEYGNAPKGRELKMRHLGKRDKNNPIRNKLTTNNSARLMYEIVNEKAISPEYSRKIQDHLERDLNPEAWKNIDPNFEFNPVLAFFGESLPAEVTLLSKAGWTSSTRHEVAYITTPDQEAKYILAIFTEDKTYAQNWDIFPEFSEVVFKAMTN